MAISKEVLEIGMLNFVWLYEVNADRGITVVKVLYYKSEGRWFDPS